MSRSKNRKTHKKPIKKRPAQEPEEKGLNRFAAIPGMLMTGLIAIMLILDTFIGSMSAKQYEVFQTLAHATNILAAFAGGAAIISEAKRHRINLRPSYVFFGLFLILVIISTCVNGWDEKALLGLPYRNIGVPLLMIMVVIYMGASGFVMNTRYKKGIMLAYLIVSDAVAASAIFDRFINRIPAYGAKTEFSALFFNGNHYGYYILMAVIIAAGFCAYGKEKVRLAGIISLAFNVCVLILNGTMGCIVSAVIMLFLLALTLMSDRKGEYRKMALYAVGFLTVCLAAAFICSSAFHNEVSTLFSDIGAVLQGEAQGAEGHNRIMLWSHTVEYIKEHPLAGYGCEGMSDMMFAEIGRSNPHNEILTYAAYFGIPAACMYAAGVISTLAEHFRYSKTTMSRIAALAASGYLISSFFGVAMFYTTPFFFIFLGLSAEKAR